MNNLTLLTQSNNHTIVNSDIVFGVINELSSLFINQPFVAPSDWDITVSGRHGSKSGEPLIFDYLHDLFGNRITKTQNTNVKKEDRDWKDFVFEDKSGNLHPFNLKITKIQTDNTSSFASLVWALTDAPMDINYNMKSGEACKKLVTFFKNFDLNESNFIPPREYFFLVVNKNNPADMFVNGVRGLATYQSNPSNLPFQSNWKKNRNYAYDRDYEETLRLIKNSMFKGFLKTNDPLDVLRDYLLNECVSITT